MLEEIKKLLKKLLFVLGSVIVIPGCTVGPSYKNPPKVDLTKSWKTRISAIQKKKDDSTHMWWKKLNDPVLNKLVALCKKRNLSIKQAISRIKESRALLAVSTGEKYPSLNASGSYAYQNWHLNTNLPIADDIALPTGLFLGIADASWEVDLFGRVKRSIESARADYEAEVESYRNVLVTLFAEVCSTYIDIRTLQQRIEYLRNNAADQGKTLKLVQIRFDTGYVAKSDLTRSIANLYNTESEIPPLINSLGEAKHRLAILLGKQAGTLNDRLLPKGSIPDLPKTINTGIPCEVIRQRPDIRQRERELASATAKVGIETANLYPKFSLSGSFTDIGIPLTKDQHFNLFFWGIGPSFSWDLFNGGRTRNRIKAAKAVVEQKYNRYRQNILVATKEVEDAIEGINQSISRDNSLKKAVDATEESLKLVKLSYFEGLLDFQPVLDSERSLFMQQDQFAKNKGEELKNFVSLYKALGGGW